MASGFFKHIRADTIIAVSSVIISTASLITIVRHAQIMQRMLAADTWPHVQYSTGNNKDGDSMITFTLQNTGVGPARLEHFSFTYEGREILTEGDLLRLFSDIELETLSSREEFEHVYGRIGTSFLAPLVIPAGESHEFITLREDEANADFYSRLDRGRFELTATACYCSLLDQCWTSSSASSAPEPVDHCPSERSFLSQPGASWN